MYHLEVIVGESPLFATVKLAPLAPYVGPPLAVKSLEPPLPKAIFLLVPNAGSAGHPSSTVSGLSLKGLGKLTL